MTEAAAIRTAGQARPVPRQMLRAPRDDHGRKLPRRGFTADYKLAILAEYDRCTCRATRVRCCGEKVCTRH